MKLNRIVLLVSLLLVLCVAGTAFGKAQITIWCMAFDPHVNPTSAWKLRESHH